jgi:N-6 DNA Methylase
MAYSSIVVEGGLFPADLLERVAAGNMAGQAAKDFVLDGQPPVARLTDEIQSAFSDVRDLWHTFERRRGYTHTSLTSLTREAWVVPVLERLGFTLVYQPAAAVVDGETYALSHRIGDEPDAPPAHVVGLDQSLDLRGERARRSPQALLQEYLNRSVGLWGLVSNGRQLRLLRNSARLARPSYVEIDLEALVEGNLYSEFVLVYHLLHRSRFPSRGADAADCWLETYYQAGIEQGGRVREKLREGVEAALRELGSSLLRHPQSDGLREAVRSGELTAEGYYRELLHLIYRILFLLVVEERKLLFPPRAERPDRQVIYSRYYGVAHLREHCERYFAEDPHSDLWPGLLQTFRLFRDDGAARELGLRALDGELFGDRACAHLERAGCANVALLRSMHHLSTFLDDRVRRRVNYAALDVEELGSVYESLLEYRPHLDLDAPTPFDLLAGSERKATGSYYTPPDLVRVLVDQALVPVVEERLTATRSREEKEKALLSLRVCDPASGSGHFLLAAARRIGRELAKVRSGEDEPTPELYRPAVRDVIRTCVYAVDKNPLAVDLCKLALWLEGYNAGLPLNFLDHHVKCGDSLVGVLDLGCLERPIPDEAYVAVGDDAKKVAAYYKKRNREEAQGQSSFEGRAADAGGSADYADDFALLAALDDRTSEDVQAKADLYASLRGGPTWIRTKMAADVWTAAFFLPFVLSEHDETMPVPTTDVVRQVLAGQNTTDNPAVAVAVADAESHPFFHWPLEFPEVFRDGGFDGSDWSCWAKHDRRDRRPRRPGNVAMRRPSALVVTGMRWHRPLSFTRLRGKGPPTPAAW